MTAPTAAPLAPSEAPDAWERIAIAEYSWPLPADAAGGPDAMDVLRAALGIPAASVGDEVHATLGGAGALDGVVDYATPDFLGVRTDAGLFRFFGRNAFGSVVGIDRSHRLGRSRSTRAISSAEPELSLMFFAAA